MAQAAWWRSAIFRCMEKLRRSRYRQRSRLSSFASDFSSTMNGSVSHRLRISIAEARTSISPVGMRGLAMAGGRARTSPSTAMQYSNFSSCASERSASGRIRVHDDLREAVAVAHVDEPHPAVVPVPVHPSVEGHAPTRVGCPQLAAGDGPFHALHDRRLYRGSPARCKDFAVHDGTCGEVDRGPAPSYPAADSHARAHPAGRSLFRPEREHDRDDRARGVPRPRREDGRAVPPPVPGGPRRQYHRGRLAERDGQPPVRPLLVPRRLAVATGSATSAR